MARKWKNDYKMFDISQKQGESDIDYYLRLAKMADTRITRLEELSKQPGYENVTGYAYAKAKKELSTFGWKRFERLPPPSKNDELKRELLSTVKTFLSSPTSTKGGISKVYANKAAAINAKYGTQFTWEDMADFYNKGAADKLNKSFGSKTVLKTIGTIQKAQKIAQGAGENLNITSMEKENALSALRKYSAMNKMGISKEERAKLRQIIKGSSDWLEANEEDLPF